MLVLRRKEGQWVYIKHKSGDEIKIKLYDLMNGKANMAFDDPDKNFIIQRQERLQKPEEETGNA